MTFAECLQELREDRNISRKELAAFLNVSVSTLGMYEQGRREPNIDMLIKLADYFNVSLDFLVGRSADNEERKNMLEALRLKIPQEYKDIINFMLETQG